MWRISYSGARNFDMYTHSSFATAFLIVVILASTASLQYAHDLAWHDHANHSAPITPFFARAFDLGLHSALASWLWMTTITDLPFFQSGAANFFDTFTTITALDPKFSFPYAYTTIVLPLAKQYPPRIDKTIEIGRLGVLEADPDWRIPFYLAATYQLDKLDLENAVKYYEVTAETPGVPETIQKFAANFGISAKLRAETRRIWESIYASTENPLLKERAKKNIDRMNLFDFLEWEIRAYKSWYGKLPTKLDDLVSGHILREIPPDPFGAALYINPEGYLTLNGQNIGTAE